jgi:hypothetical protein
MAWMTAGDAAKDDRMTTTLRAQVDAAARMQS